MKKVLLAFTVCVSLFTVFTSMIVEKKASAANTTSKDNTISVLDQKLSDVNYWIDSLYAGMHLSEAGLNREVFFNACKGYEYFLSENALTKPGLLSICDFSQPS